MDRIDTAAATPWRMGFFRHWEGLEEQGRGPLVARTDAFRLLLSPRVSVYSFEGDTQRIERAQQRLAELLQKQRSRHRKPTLPSTHRGEKRQAERCRQLSSAYERPPPIPTRRPLLCFPQAIPSASAAIRSRTEGILDILSERRELLEGVTAPEAGPLATPAQVEAAEGVAVEADTLAAAGRLLLGPQQVAAIEGMNGFCSALRRHLQEAHEKLDEAAKRHSMQHWIKALTVQAALVSWALERSETSSHWQSSGQLEALILERASLHQGARQFVVHASATSEGNIQQAEALRLTPMHLQELVKLVVGGAAEESAAEIAPLTSPLQTQLAAVMDRSVQLESKAKHRVAGRLLVCKQQIIQRRCDEALDAAAAARVLQAHAAAAAADT
ncbi:hypothetical protein Emag_004845 [Eimeria magna]